MSGWRRPLDLSQQQRAEPGETMRRTDRPRFLHCPFGSAAVAA